MAILLLVQVLLTTVSADIREKMIPASNVSSGSNSFNYGQQPFLYTPPEGFKSLSTTNTPSPAIADGREHFQAITGPGNAAGYAYGDNSVNQPSGNQGSAFNPAGLDVAPFPNASSNVPNASYTSHVLDFLQERSTVTCTFGSGAGITLQVLLSVDGVAWRDQGNVADWQRDITFADGQNFRYVRTVSTNGTTPYGLFISATNVASPGILGTAQGIFPNGLWWIKDRVNSNQHQLVDSVRGATQALTTPAAGVETAYVAPTGDSVAWCWNAPDVWSPDGSGGAQGTIAATGRRNVDAGFSLFQYTGTGAAVTLAHGLGSQPGMILIKNHAVAGGSAGSWIATFPWFNSDPDYMLRLNESAAGYVAGQPRFTQLPDNDFVYLAGDTQSSGNGTDYSMYCWSAIPGYSAFGSYTGNSNADGPFVYTGLKPAFVMIRRTDSASGWCIQDSTRDPFNPSDKDLRAELAAGEETGSIYYIDFLSNGFKLRTSWSQMNGSGGTYIYAAFAENPFQSPVTAR